VSACRPDPRALAAQALASVVAGQSLRAAFAALSTKLHEARDRALLSSLLHEGARWWLRFDTALGSLLERPLRERESDIHALLVLGLVQLEIMGLSDYAAVAATVEATRALRKPAFAGLVNAVLRRWLRERETRRVELDRDAVTRTAHPRWLIERFDADWPEQAEAILTVNNAPASLWLRVNRRRVMRADFAAQLAEQGVVCRVPDDAPDALLLDASRDVTTLPGYAQGLFSVQDGAAQQAARLLDLHDGQHVLDACAAPGGKTGHILELADCALTALDSDPARVLRVGDNLARLGFSARVLCADCASPADWSDGAPFERILLDAPCTASGVVKRHPDIKWLRRESDLAQLAATQGRMLDALWQQLAPGGKLLYATCSVFPQENAQTIDSFLARCSGARRLPLAGLEGGQLLPDARHDGFFYALLEKQ